MLFGSCCYSLGDNMKNMNIKSININGSQCGLIVNFEIIQTFYHSEEGPKEVSYIFPNDHKICIYDTIFVVGEEIIKPKIESKEEAKKTYDEAVKSGRTAVYGTNIGHGMSQFNIGNIEPNIECKVILKIAFTGQVTSGKSFYIKFPIDVYTPSGSSGCLNVNNSQFSFTLQSDPNKIDKVVSNVKNSNFDKLTKIFSIQNNIENDKNEKSIIITFETKEIIKSSCQISPTDSKNFDGCCISIVPNLPPSPNRNNEFIFLVDCSGSMDGNSIKKASECLEFFIKSLPTESYFNVIQFGSSFKKLFETSVLYNDETSEKAINLALNLKADLGGTNIYLPLRDIFSEEKHHGQRQIFIMTDGEVDNVGRVIELSSSHSRDNRCFTIGIGRGCDAGLVEGIARSSGGLSDFVQEGDSISDKVIPQLKSSLYPSITSLEIHIEGQKTDSFEISPYPLPYINSNGSSVIYLRRKKLLNPFSFGKSEYENGILITGNYGTEPIEILIDEFYNLINIKEDKYGCSSGKNIGNAILPLFAFSTLQKFERVKNISNDDKAKIIELSIQSGVLCKYTGYVGMTEKPNILDQEYQYRLYAQQRRCYHCGGGGMRSLKSCVLYEGKNERRQYEEMKRREEEMKRREEEMKRREEEMKRREYEERERKEYEERERKEYEERERKEYEEIKRREEEMKRREYDQKQKESNECEQRKCKEYEKNEKEFINEKNRQEKILPIKYELVTLTRYQKAGGFWDNLEAVKSITGITLDHLDEIKLEDKNIENNCLATIYAIAAMRIKSPDEKNSWSMIEQKALSWLRKTLPDINVDQVISKIELLF